MLSELLSKEKKYEEYSFFYASDKCAAVANYFINYAINKSANITRMKVLKLSFLALGFGMATLEKEIFTDVVEAWPKGPVIPGLFFELKNTNEVLVSQPLATDYELKNDELELIQIVNNKYGAFSSEQLSILSHKPNTPWSITTRSLKKEIERKVIKSYYRNLLAQTNDY